MNKNISILVLDNYDSFTYNLVHIIKALGYTNLEVHRNDKITIEEIARFDKILLSPGPGIPSEAGILQDVIRTYAGKKSIFGVCLGHQAIGEVFGGTLTNLEKVYHGIATKTKILDSGVLFAGIPHEITTGRYHSWVVDRQDFPDVLEITAEDDQGKIMALKHKTLDLVGVQFHPESILTEFGQKMMQNWLEA
ncbi:MAG TPA: aminodeoxychorismate/anthranilate synthase component II [Cytophaga sp.]|jgi:anthranilate synthase component 2|nr:aminodeoxychorismate/anthranilate synthase component II [Cytophaga sp.]